MNLKLWLAEAARRLGFDLCGVAPAEVDERHRQEYLRWLQREFHGEMGYMKRFERLDLHSLLPTVRSVICVGMNYHTAYPLSIESTDPTRAWIARYAWGDDYHEVMKERMEQLLAALRSQLAEPFDARIYVDTGPVLERSVAWAAGLGWIAKNTCLINERMGSWFFLGEILTSLELDPDLPAPDRCGSCTRCLDACPTQAIPEPYVLDATRCISYYTIEVKGAMPESVRSQMGRHVFGCDICQDVCPWNRSAPTTSLPAFQPRRLKVPPTGSDREEAPTSPSSSDATRGTSRAALPPTFNPPLEQLAALSEEEFREVFRDSPVQRPRYRGFLRNVCVAMGNSGDSKFLPILERLVKHSDALVRHHAAWALRQLAANKLC